MNLLPLSDMRWEQYRSGYNRAPLDVRPWIRSLLGDVQVKSDHWDFLWMKLHHQGTLGEASYAVVPYMTDYVRRIADRNWNIFAFVAVVELQRTEQDNPPVPAEILEAYQESLQELPWLALRGSSQDHWSEDQVRAVAACLAVSKGNRLLAQAYLELSEQLAREFLVNQGVLA